HLESGLVVGEVPAAVGGLPEPGVQALDRIRGVHDPADFRRERQKRSELLPRLPPQPNDDRIALPPFGFELVEARQRGFDRGCGVDRAQRFADRPQCAFDAYRRLARTKWTT